MARHEADELATRAAVRAKQQKLASQHIERTKAGNQGKKGLDLPEGAPIFHEKMSEARWRKTPCNCLMTGME